MARTIHRLTLKEVDDMLLEALDSGQTIEEWFGHNDTAEAAPAAASMVGVELAPGTKVTKTKNMYVIRQKHSSGEAIVYLDTSVAELLSQFVAKHH